MGYRNPHLIAEKITNTIIEQIESTGELIWRKPWITNKPINGYRGTAYKGINIWLLMAEKYNKKYVSNQWFTMWQIKQLQKVQNISLQRGSKGCFVVIS